MGALGYGLDTMTDVAVTGSSFAVLTCSVFPPALPLSRMMPRAKGAPGSLLEGARSWIDGGAALQRANQALTSVAAAIGPDVWSGDDRDGFDRKVTELSQQLDIAANYANAVGAGLAGLSAPLLAVGPLCVTMAGFLIADLIAFEAAVASVVGNLGASEAAFAVGCTTAATCLEVMSGTVWGIAAAMSAAAAVLIVGSGIDAHEQGEHGDTSAASNFAQAEVVGLLEFGEGKAVDALTGKMAGNAFRGASPARTLEEKFVRDLATDKLSDRLGGFYDAGKDLAEGDFEGAFGDATGLGDKIDATKDLLGMDDDPPNDHTEDRYELPPTNPVPHPPVIPLPPATGEPNVVPIPNAVGPGEAVPIGDDGSDEADDPTVVPRGSDINGSDMNGERV